MKNQHIEKTAQCRKKTLKSVKNKQNKNYIIDSGNFEAAFSKSEFKSYASLARKIHCDKSQITNWRKGRPITFTNLCLLASALNVNWYYLVGERKSDKPDLFEMLFDDARKDRQAVLCILKDQGIEVIEKPTNKSFKGKIIDSDGVLGDLSSDIPVMEYSISFHGSEPLPIQEKDLEFLCAQAKKTIACLFESYRDFFPVFQINDFS